MKTKHKTKRYQEGGKTEEDLKRKGLAASNAELEARRSNMSGLEKLSDSFKNLGRRLMAGNIDDPRSEAYRQFGAGRAKMDIEAKTPVPESAKETSDYSGRGAKSYGDDYMDVPHSTVTKASQKTAADEDVTNESSYSPRSTYQPPDIGDATNDNIKPKPKLKPKPRKRVSQSFPVDEAGIESRRKTAMSGSKEPPLAKIGKAIKGTMESAGRSYDNSFAKRMKSGGKVSSASSRADGIAQRGKTRGRIC